jgi:hypothetical protein
VSGTLPDGLSLDAASGALSGIPSASGTFPFTVQIIDSGIGGGQQSQSMAYQIQILDVLRNTTSCPLPTGREGDGYNAPLTASGGTGVYRFTLGAALPDGLYLADSNVITGTPSGPSDTVLHIQVTSGTQTTQPQLDCRLTVLGRLPTTRLQGFFNTPDGGLLTSSLFLDSPSKEDVTGRAVLSFTSDVPNSSVKDNQQVQFESGQKDASGLLRLFQFTIPAQQTSMNLPAIQKSNVAGTIQISLTNLRAGNQDLVAPDPLRFTVLRAIPEILSELQVNTMGRSVIELTLKAASTTCELTSAIVTFTASEGSELENASGGSVTIPVDLTRVFQSFAPSTTAGCGFLLHLPFNISGTLDAIASASVVLRNTVGDSPPVKRQLVQ